NTTSTSFEITLIDDIDPVISENPLDRNESLDGDCDFVIPDYTAEISPTDNCDPAVDVTQTPAIGAVFSGHGTTQTITLTAEDNAGNTASVDFEITLVDEIDPTITCPATQTYSLDSNCVFTVPDFISLATFSDNCDADLDVVQSPALGEIITDGDGTYTVTLTATDDALNSATCTFDLVLEDNTAPSFTCPGDDVLNLTDSCSTSLPDYITEMEEAGSFEDNCDIQTVTQTPLAGTEISSATTVIIEAIDINGNSTSCTFEVTLEDVESPQFETCPADTIFIDLADQCDYVLEDFTTLVGATDNCAVADLVQSPAPGAVTLQGNSSQPVTITATDDAGNSTICSFMVATVDDTAPVINDCPSDQTFNKDENCGFALPDFTGDVTYDEPCTATVNQSPSANTFIMSDSTEVTLTVTDPYGNFSECIFYVYLEDNEAPTLTCNDLTIEVESCPIALPNFADSMLIEDNCEIASITQSPEVGDFVMPGEHEITLTAYDNSGNSTSCTFIVTYEDLTAPEIICPDDIVESAAPGECGKVITFDDPMGSDNCDVDNVDQIQGPSSGSFFEVGETLIEYEVTDFSGNTNTCSFTITVTDDEAPELTCPDDIIQCEQTVTFDAPMAVDNCEINTFDQTSSNIFQSGDTFPIGITTLEYTAEDIHGNLSTCSFTVEVEEPIDTELPDFPEGFCPEDSPADITTYVDSELNWNWIDGTDVDGIFNETEPGVYNLNFTAEIGTCFEEFNRELEVYPAAVADAGPDLETCGDMKEVNATTFGSQINWTASSPMVDANPSNLVEDPILVANEFGSYELTLDVVTENGCTAQDQMSVAFYEMPGEPDAGEDYEFSFKYEVELQGNYAGAGDITWRTVAGQGTVVNESSPTTMITNLGEGTNIFEIEISNGVCPTTRDSAIVIVNGLNIPSGFSPNGDNKNDRYVIRGIENAITSEIRVFNRWGSLVYEQENYNNDWEGLSKGGNPLPEDTYFYVLEINESLSFRGYIVIRR
ncbi:HYR domain-containing protein, partial [Halocola ammonii]